MTIDLTNLKPGDELRLIWEAGDEIAVRSDGSLTIRVIPSQITKIIRKTEPETIVRYCNVYAYFFGEWWATQEGAYETRGENYQATLELTYCDGVPSVRSVRGGE